ncbi:MAG: glycosyltransferase family 39 protein [Oscillospiraceae bacterium]|nr:glycosyltransferase family 39 protein [Oscillospiraceae bacterium]
MISKSKFNFYPALLGIMPLLISLCSPLHPFAKNTPAEDSSVFLLIGKSMSQSIMPYRDLFDHKGPLLYVINWLGMLIGFTGVWLIELACIFIAVLFCYKTARRFFDKASSFLGTVATFIALFSWFEGGNLTESYALPLFFGALYCLTGYFVQNFELKHKQILISGLCMGGVLMLRPNMIGLWIGFCAVIFIHSLIIRKFKLAFSYILFFIVGILASVLPFIIWLGAKGLLNDFYRCYIQFNFEYVHVPLMAVIESMRNGLKYPIVPIVAAILIALLFKKDNRKNHDFVLILSMIAAFCATALLTSLSGFSFPHYYMAYLPCLLLPVAWMIQKVINHVKIKPIIIWIIICLVLNGSLSIGKGMIELTLKTDADRNVLASFIKENTAQDEPILYIGLNCYIYLQSDRAPAGYYPYYAPESMNYPAVIDSYIDEIALKNPRLIAYGNKWLPEKFRDYINDNYTVVFENRYGRILTKS